MHFAYECFVNSALSYNGQADVQADVKNMASGTTPEVVSRGSISESRGEQRHSAGCGSMLSDRMSMVSPELPWLKLAAFSCIVQ